VRSKKAFGTARARNFLKRRPSRRKKKVRKGASSSDGSQPATVTRMVVRCFCTKLSVKAEAAVDRARQVHLGQDRELLLQQRIVLRTKATPPVR
jgi:hypothetical protein